jgi:uncharacterized protein (TIGR02646 family)
MRSIAKGSEPEGLRSFRARGRRYGDFPEAPKQKLRESLVAEQRGLCCYCMSSISASSSAMKIEHWLPQRGPSGRDQEPSGRDQELVYANLLAACPGGQDHPPRHCDTLKGSRALRYNPADPQRQIENIIDYGLNGTISSQDADFNAELGEVLGLNIPKLVNSRKGTLDGILDWWRLEQGKRQGAEAAVPKDVIERKRAKLLSQTLANLEPFVQVRIWWLDQRLAGQAARPSSSLATTLPSQS